jgi:hypothetical protein
MKTKKGDYIHLVEGYGGRWAIAKLIDGWWYSCFWPNTFHLHPIARALTLQELVVAEGIATFASAPGAYKRYRVCGRPDMTVLARLWAAQPLEWRTRQPEPKKAEPILNMFTARQKLWQRKAVSITEAINDIQDKIIMMLEKAYQAGRKGI